MAMVTLKKFWLDFKVYTCSIHNAEYEFNLEDELGSAEQWHWDTAGIFSGEDGEMTYICLNDHTAMYGDGVTRSPQLLLIEFSMERSEEYRAWPYIVEPAADFSILRDTAKAPIFASMLPAIPVRN